MREKEKQINNEHKISFTEDEKRLLKKYIEEYNDIYQKILLLTPEDFIKKLIKHVEFTLRSKINKYSQETRNKVQKFLIDKIYQSDYKNALIIRKNIKKMNIYELSKNFFKDEIIPHCDRDKKNGFYIHTCGEKFQTYKYKTSNDYYHILNYDKNKKAKDINTIHYENILFCKKCNMIYKGSLIKFKCAETSIDFYSKINIANSDNEDDLPYATWSKYHCNVVINDLMKCQKCSNILYLFKKSIKKIEKNFIFCKNCNQMWSPIQLRWECLICKKKFTCDAKAYNPLEFKPLKICVKEAIVDRIRAYPQYLDCKCNIDFSKTIFFHRNSCKGELFFGELNGKKTVVCNKCDSIGFYDGYVWTCPICLKKTKTILRDNKFDDNKSIDVNIEKDNFETKSAFNSRINDKHKYKDKDIEKSNNNVINGEKDSISVSRVSKDSKYRNRRFYNLFKSNLNSKASQSNTDLKNSTSSNNYLKNKHNLFKDYNGDNNNNNNDSVERRKIKDRVFYTTIEKDKDLSDIDKNNNKNKNISEIKKMYNISRNSKEEYFKNSKKKYVTNLSINTRIKTDYNNNNNSSSKNDISLKKIKSNLGSLLSSVTTTRITKIIKKNNNEIDDNKKETKANNNNEDNNNNNNDKDDDIKDEKSSLNYKKSMSIIDFSISNIKDMKNLLNKYETKININLKSSAMNFHRPSYKNMLNKYMSTENQSKEKDKNKSINKEKEKSLMRNKTSINDSNTEESQLNSKNEIYGENIKKKDSFMTKFIQFKRSSRISTSKLINNNDNNNNKANIKNNISISNNDSSEFIQKELEIKRNKDKDINESNSLSKKNEFQKFPRKSKIFHRLKNINITSSNILFNNNENNENKSMNRIRINNEYKTDYNINDNKNEKDTKESKESNADNYFTDNYNNKKGSNSTAADSDNTTKIIYHGKNPKQSFRIKKSNKNIVGKYNNFNINDYSIIKKIGQGSFGQIFQVEDKYGNKFAMKKIILTSESDIKKIEKEYQILIDLNFQTTKDNSVLNLVKIYGYNSKQLDPTTYVIYVLMELAVADWEKEILYRQKKKKYYTEKELMKLLSSLINTFAELQKKNISHRDIKPQNILLFKDSKYKLADFGEAKELYKDIAPTNKQTLRGTELYMAPALFHALRGKKVIKYINHNPYKSDVFSFGLCALFAATLCFESIYDIRELNNNVSIHVILEKYLRKNYSFDVINIISQMLDINETTRKDFIEMQKEFESIGYD